MPRWHGINKKKRSFATCFSIPTKKSSRKMWWDGEKRRRKSCCHRLFYQQILCCSQHIFKWIFSPLELINCNIILMGRMFFYVRRSWHEYYKYFAKLKFYEKLPISFVHLFILHFNRPFKWSGAGINVIWINILKKFHYKRGRFETLTPAKNW